jgi:hypothetical protein
MKAAEVLCLEKQLIFSVCLLYRHVGGQYEWLGRRYAELA